MEDQTRNPNANISNQVPTTQPMYAQSHPGVPHIITVQNKGNGLGVAGFVLALLAVLFCWIPIIYLILWVMGLIFSLIGVLKAPRGLAIAGLVISSLWIILTLIIFGAFLEALMC